MGSPFGRLSAGSGAQGLRGDAGEEQLQILRSAQDDSNSFDDNSTLGNSNLMAVDAVATAHTLDDQAETVLGKFLRGAWTEGLSGIHPVVEFAKGAYQGAGQSQGAWQSRGIIVRPLLGTTRAEVEAYLKALGQDWREDSTNRHLMFTRNRIRHELLPILEGWNPRLKEHLAQMAELARDEEAWWEGETGRLAAGVILRGKPVRGGGRAASEGMVLDLAGLKELSAAVQRRVIRRAAAELGFAPDFAGTEALRELGFAGRAGQKCELGGRAAGGADASRAADDGCALPGGRVGERGSG